MAVRIFWYNTMQNPVFKHDDSNACGVVYYLILTTAKSNKAYSFDFYLYNLKFDIVLGCVFIVRLLKSSSLINLSCFTLEKKLLKLWEY